jgi:hypothetical protein
MTINGSHLISNIIELCGGVNAFASHLFNPGFPGGFAPGESEVIISSVSHEHAETR